MTAKLRVLVLIDITVKLCFSCEMFMMGKLVLFFAVQTFSVNIFLCL